VTTRVLGGLLFGVQAADVSTFVGMSSTMLLVGLLASFRNGRHADQVPARGTCRRAGTCPLYLDARQ